MSKKYVLIPLRTFKEICTNVRKNGDTVTGVVKNLDEAKEQKKRLCKKLNDLNNLCF